MKLTPCADRTSPRWAAAQAQGVSSARRWFEWPRDEGVEDAGEIGVGIEAVELGGLRQRIDDRRPAAAFVGAEEEKILARYGDGSKRSFSGIVVDGEASVAGVARQRLPALEGNN